MPIARSKITAQGQISVPVEVRKKLGAGPGSVLEWDESNEQVIVRRVGTLTSAEVHDALFPDRKSRKALTNVREAIRKYIRQKHARG